jgi:hypothetical protein
MLRKLRKVAHDRAVSLNSAPEETSVDAQGKFRMFHYRINGTCTYKSFVSFVNGLHEQRIPCSFERFTLKAISGEQVSLHADLVFTTIR